jgi:hypothetical protein
MSVAPYPLPKDIRPHSAPGVKSGLPVPFPTTTLDLDYIEHTI